MKPIYEATPSARYLVIQTIYKDKRLIVEEAASIDYAEKIIIGHELDKFMESGYFVVRNEERKHIIVVNKEMQPVALFAIVKINRRICP